MDFSVVSGEKEAEEELERMAESGKVRREDLVFINIYKLMRFLRCPLGSEMREAKREGRLYREQPFVIGVPAREVIPDTKENSRVLVQGIIDAFYETEQGIVLMDYKTDHLEKGQESLLVERYEKQMELYARALEKITGQQVVRKVLYSFSLNQEIEVK